MFMYVFEVSLHIFLYTYGTHFKANNPQQVAETSWQSGEYTHFDTVWPPLKNPGYTPEEGLYVAIGINVSDKRIL